MSIRKGTGSRQMILRFMPVGLLLLGLFIFLSSGYTLSVGNKDKFCVSCHVMVPFAASWQESKHGGRNRRGIVVQCNQCHLPHDGLPYFTAAKLYHGVRYLVSNLSIDGKMVDWSGNADRQRTVFTYDSGCLSCHANLLPEWLSSRGIQAHNQYQISPASRACTGCHRHVGHREAMATAENFFHSNSTAKK
jgi:nitrate/TMAO reductase-like tetraheme cytochrome c subunit